MKKLSKSAIGDNVRSFGTAFSHMAAIATIDQLLGYEDMNHEEINECIRFVVEYTKEISKDRSIPYQTELVTEIDKEVAREESKCCDKSSS